MTTPTRTVDPYRDLDWIDANAPRTVHAFVAAITVTALLTGIPWLVAIPAAQLAVGLTLGRRWCLPCRLYFDVIQPRIGEGEIEDARAPRFANVIGVGFLASATVAFALGLGAVGWALTGVVAALSTVSAVTGFCVGCAVYARIWGCETCPVPRSG